MKTNCETPESEKEEIALTEGLRTQECRGTISEFRMELLERLQALSPVYTFIDREKFSVIDMAINGNNGEVEGFRIILQMLPPIFDEEEKTADKISQYINEY